ncbi:DUF72 domain-containing protein [Dactylosporangium sp. NBC_01737]|uniref:DUF72 domain-containing protein n=1 Tax=Dactylosporangium sp. NBC_01737 TaxID=2975959 RepID=UPI002E0F1E51|nr:DUF72 domain-containing protein [Dactylosporangium sp. NBC_01737]
MGEIKVGTASWTHRTLLESGWYPHDANSPERRLAYYATQFPIVEVDSTYYALPAERNTALWAQRTPATFTFNIKAFGLLTGHPIRVSTLPKDLRPDAGKQRLYADDLPPKTYEEVWTRFLAALDPLVRAGKLGVVLFQFPPWFTARAASRQTLLDVVARCRPLRVAVEFRHASWFDGDSEQATLRFLRERDIPYVAVDMPQGHRSSVPPVVAATSDLAVVRFHGRGDHWTSTDIDEKFAYLYSEHELADWATKLHDLAAQTDETHVLLNNCCADNAQRNAAQLMELLNQP